MAECKALDLDRALKAREKLKDRIYLIGVELEGGWKELPEGTRLVHDGSVIIQEGTAPQIPLGRQQAIEDIGRRLRGGLISSRTAVRFAAEQGVSERELQDYLNGGGVRSQMGGLMTGEVPSPPMPTKQLSAWMQKFYPARVNATCGLHVHQSFKSALHYQQLMPPSFQFTVLKYVGAWAKEENLPKDHPIWERLAGKSDYCQHKYYADQQAQAKEKSHDRQRAGHRYTVISYPYNRLGTMECRLLPMMETCDQGIRAVQHVLDITNAFLLMTAGRERKERKEVVADGPEHHILRVDEVGRRSTELQ